MKGKILVLSLVAITLSVVGSAMSLAYLTDADVSTANFTVGKVKIRTIATSIGRSDGTNAYTDTDLVNNSSGYAEYLTKECTNIVPEPGKPAMCNRNIFVQNTGDVAAYIRVKVQIPFNDYYNGLDVVLGGSKTEYSITSPPSPSSSDPIQIVRCSANTSMQCVEYVFVRNQPLQPGTMTSSPAIMAMTYNEILQTSTTDDGVEGSSASVNLSSTGIKVYTQAIQAQGFSSATEAFSNFR